VLPGGNKVAEGGLQTTSSERPDGEIASPPGPETPEPGAASPRSGAESVALRGFDTGFFWNEDYIRITTGSPLSNSEADEAVIAKDLLGRLGFESAAAAVGASITLSWQEPVPAGTHGAASFPGLPFALAARSVPYRVVGVFEQRGSLSLRGTSVLVPTASARRIATFDPETIRALLDTGSMLAGHPALDVYIEPGADLEGIEARIKAMGFETISGAEIVSRIRRSILILQAILGGLGGIAIAVATLGIINTLVTAVFERMKEIGVMKAVGARRKDIRMRFLAEASLIGFAGGLLGIGGGFAADHLLAFVVGQIVRRQGGDDPGAIAVHTPLIALGCLAFSVGLSLLAGTYPAARAARLDPVRTLRYE